MADLLVKPALGSIVHNITPQSAGWGHVGFAVHDLAAGDVLGDSGDANELCIVLLSGSASFSAGDSDFGLVEGRNSVFDGGARPRDLCANANALACQRCNSVRDCHLPGARHRGQASAAPYQTRINVVGNTGARVQHPTCLQYTVRTGTGGQFACG